MARTERGISKGLSIALTIGSVVAGAAVFGIVGALFAWTTIGLVAGLVAAVLAYLGLSTLIPQVSTRIGNVDMGVLDESLADTLRRVHKQHDNIANVMAQTTDQRIRDAMGRYLSLDERIIRYLTANPDRTNDALHFINLYQDQADELATKYLQQVQSGGNIDGKVIAGAYDQLSQAAKGEFDKLQSGDEMELDKLAATIKGLASQDGYVAGRKRNAIGLTLGAPGDGGQGSARPTPSMGPGEVPDEGDETGSELPPLTA